MEILTNPKKGTPVLTRQEVAARLAARGEQALKKREGEKDKHRARPAWFQLYEEAARFAVGTDQEFHFAKACVHAIARAYPKDPGTRVHDYCRLIAGMKNDGPMLSPLKNLCLESALASADEAEKKAEKRLRFSHWGEVYTMDPPGGIIREQVFGRMLGACRRIPALHKRLDALQEVFRVIDRKDTSSFGNTEEARPRHFLASADPQARFFGAGVVLCALDDVGDFLKNFQLAQDGTPQEKWEAAAWLRRNKSKAVQEIETLRQSEKKGNSMEDSWNKRQSEATTLLKTIRAFEDILLNTRHGPIHRRAANLYGGLLALLPEEVQAQRCAHVLFRLNLDRSEQKRSADMYKPIYESNPCKEYLIKAWQQLSHICTQSWDAFLGAQKADPPQGSLVGQMCLRAAAEILNRGKILPMEASDLATSAALYADGGPAETQMALLYEANVYTPKSEEGNSNIFELNRLDTITRQARRHGPLYQIVTAKLAALNQE